MKYPKLIAFITILLGGSLAVEAKHHLQVFTSSKDPILIEVSDNLIMTVAEDKLIFSDTEQQTSISIDDLKTFNYIDLSTSSHNALAVDQLTLTFDRNTIYFSNAPENKTCKVIDLSGKTILEYPSEMFFSIDISRLAHGVYIISLDGTPIFKFSI